MRKAYSLIRREPHYRHDAFLSGLAAAGYEVHDAAPVFPVKPGDVLVIWNRYHEREQLADRFEAAGGAVLVAENGYVRGRHDGGDYYALAVHGHNGSGSWYCGGPERWQTLGVELKPWMGGITWTGPGHILVAPNRPFGMRGTVMPANWTEECAKRLRKLTTREVRIRCHPGNGPSSVPLVDDLRGAWAVVIWSSSVGVKALIEGIPVVCEAPYWICKPATVPVVDGLYNAWDMDRLRRGQLRRLAWAQWSIAEIASGEPFGHLLHAA